MNVVPLRRNLFLSKSNVDRKPRDFVNGIDLYCLLPVVVEAKSDFQIFKTNSQSSILKHVKYESMNIRVRIRTMLFVVLRPR